MEANNHVKILLIDDRAENLFALEVILSSENYLCMRANSGKEALKILRHEQDFAIILLDVQMPVMDGFETLELIRKIEKLKHTPVIFLTASMDAEQVYKGYQVGAVDYIIKPFLPEILKAKVAVFVDLYKKTNELLIQYKEKKKRANELFIADKELDFQTEEKGKRAAELIIANEEKEKRAAELSIANKELVFQNREKEKRADELLMANKELAFQNEEKEKRASELIMANKELAFQNKEKEKRAAELIIANKELVFQNKEKEKRAVELSIANKKLFFQNREKEKRADELNMANKELAFQSKEKEKRAAELIIANKELLFQNEEKEKRAAELIIANKELFFQNEEKQKRAAELIITNEGIIIQNKKLYNQNKELEQFAYIASHDLQEPLRSLTCFVELIQNEYKNKIDENAYTYLDFIAKSSNRMQELVKGLMDYSRIGKEKVITSVDCNQIVKEVLSDLTVLIRESDAKIIVNNLPILNGYSTELRQLFQNLISNALKFRKKDIAPEILISASKQDKMWRFAIQDNGIGIAEKYNEKIFIIFKRIHNRNEYEGTGIGLSLCKKIAELHNGSIWVESKINEGSIFYFTIQ